MMNAMRIRSKKVALSAACLAAATGLFASVPGGSAPPRGELTLVTQQALAPFEYVDRGQITGLNVELVRWLAPELGVQIRLETTTAEKALERLRAGEVHALTTFDDCEGARLYAAGAFGFIEILDWLINNLTIDAPTWLMPAIAIISQTSSM